MIVEIINVRFMSHRSASSLQSLWQTLILGKPYAFGQFIARAHIIVTAVLSLLPGFNENGQFVMWDIIVVHR